jgi:hypothetical protein
MAGRMRKMLSQNPVEPITPLSLKEIQWSGGLLLGRGAAVLKR